MLHKTTQDLIKRMLMMWREAQGRRLKQGKGRGGGSAGDVVIAIFLLLIGATMMIAVTLTLGVSAVLHTTNFAALATSADRGGVRDLSQIEK